MDGWRNNYPRRGRGNYLNQGGRGRGSGQNQGGGSHRQPPAQHQRVSRPPVQVNQPPSHQVWGPRPPPQQQQNQSGGGAGAWTGRPWGPTPPAQHQRVSRPPVQVNQPPSHQVWGPRPPPQQQQNQSGGGAGAWTGRPWGPTLPVQPQTSAGDLNIQALKISEQKPLSSSSEESKESQIQPIRRPDSGGTDAIKNIELRANHFLVKFDEEKTIFHYDVDVKPLTVKMTLRKSDKRIIIDNGFSDGDRAKIAYDGEKNIFSAVQLSKEQEKVNIPEGEDLRSGSYMLKIRLVNELKLAKVNDYIRGNPSYVPRDTLQGMDLVMKENPLRKRIFVGGRFFSSRSDDLGGGLAANKGFHQSLKATSQGLALCLDYSILAFRKPLPVLEFLNQYFGEFGGANDVKRLRREINDALTGLKVRVNHRRTNQKYTIAGLTEEDARDSSFFRVDPEGKAPPQEISLLNYFKDKWEKDIIYQNIPCLELGRNKKSNKVPLEFCVLVEGQRYPKEDLDKRTAALLKNLTLAKPSDRGNTICDMVQADDGPCGDVSKNLEIELDRDMTKVVGRVIAAPELKVGDSPSVKVDAVKCQWNLLGKSFVDSKSVDRWALLDFTFNDRFNELQGYTFICNLRDRCRNLRIQMAEPLVNRRVRMNEFSSINRLENLLRNVVEECSRKSKGKLQIIVCVMPRKDPVYKYIKWISETKIGVVTQCCLSSNANKGQDQYLANLCLKINAKLGGCNFELSGRLLHFDVQDHVMFIGADVNHPAPMNKSCPSIAAVVGSVNWPAANRYAARVCPQDHRCEKIKNFGEMCLELILNYFRINKVRPARIVIFRDGVSEGQFEMVLSEELIDLKKSIYDGNYRPAITLVVAQKRHQTRLFVPDIKGGLTSDNVPPGTVVDTEIVHPHDFDFYLCSHYGGLGTSKPTHYYVLYDENSFTSDQMQKLIYDMCFTFVRCTKPVSLVPPVYYADHVAYRGRMFQEVAMDIGNRESSSTASFDPSCYRLHPDLEDVMFFV